MCEKETHLKEDKQTSKKWWFWGLTILIHVCTKHNRFNLSILYKNVVTTDNQTIFAAQHKNMAYGHYGLPPQYHYVIVVTSRQSS